MSFEPPHRLSFLTPNYCDICHNETKLTTSVSIGNSIFGWNVCKSAECQLTAVKWQESSVISKTDLIATFGDEILVMRSSGILQYGWQISSNAFIGIESTPDWFVYVSLSEGENIYKKKLVTIEELELWNQTKLPIDRISL